MAMPSELLKSLLTTHVGTSGWQLEIGTMPDKPNKCITLIDTGSWDDPNPAYALDFPKVQALIRGSANGYQATQLEAKAVKDILLGVQSQDISGDRLVSVLIQGDLAFAGRDDEMRPLFSINFALIVEPQIVGDMNRVAL